MNLEFDPLDPFPLIDVTAIPYALQKAHSRSVDHFFGFQIEPVELRMFHEVEESTHAAQWIGLHPDSLQTPYTELRWMLSKLNLKSGDTVLDLGAAYGRMGLVMQTHYPECSFLGIEISRRRVEEGNRILRERGFEKSKLIQGDVVSAGFQLPEARVYFVYDLSDRITIKRVIDQLRERSRSVPTYLVGRGRATRDQIERHEPWLTQIISPKHFGNFTIYSSA